MTALMAEEGSSSPSCWTGSANWVVGRGSVRESISYDCSSSSLDESDGDAKSSGVLLLKPEGSDPCEVTVCFREKHEIHRVYVRSTARVYEIYYASEEPHNSTEYLCTVRCGAAATEVMLPEINEGQLILEKQRHSKQNSHLPENKISDEDGWIEVKIPESQTADDRKEIMPMEIDGIAASNVQVCYEATAEISNASPCISLTLRLLSVQSKGCIYIDEICIYADPVELESTDSGPSTCLGSNLAGSPLLAMLVPGLLQLSKNENRRPDRCVFSNSAGEDGTVDNTENCDPEVVTKKMSEETCYSFPNPATGDGETPVEFTASDAQRDSSRKVPVSGTFCNPVCEDTRSWNHVDKVLDELVSRVGRIESFCLRFEEHIMKPLGSMEIRLQRMEQQLDTLTTRTCCHETFPYTKISAPEFSCHESDSEKRDCDAADALNQNARSDCPSTAESSAAPVLDSKVNPGLVVSAPEFPQDDDSLTSSNCDMHSVGKNSSEDKVSLHAGYESPYSSGCSVLYNAHFDSTVENYDASLSRAPEFLCVDGCAGSNDVSDSIEKSSPKAKRFSIETALTSALEAFMSSATLKSSGQDTLSDEPENSNEDEKKDGSVEVPAGFLSEDAENSRIYHFVSHDSALKDGREQGVHDNDQNCPEATQETPSCGHFSIEHGVHDNDQYCTEATQETPSCDHFGMEHGVHDNDQNCMEATQETSTCDHFHMERNKNSCSTLPSETVDSDSANKELTGDSDTEEAKTLNEGLIYREWIEDSDTESSADEGTILDQYQVNWTDESSTDSRNEDFPLRNWLAGRQGQHSNEEIGKTDWSPMTSVTNDHICSNSEKSKLEIERALTSALADEDSILKFASEKTNGASFLEALLGEKYNLNDDSGIESRQMHSLLQHSLDPIATLYEDQFLVDVQELSSMYHPSHVEEETVQLPPVCDSNEPAFLDQLLVEVGDFSSTSISSNVKEEMLWTPSVRDSEQPFTSLI